MFVLNVSYLLVLLFCVNGVLSVPLCLVGDFDSQLRQLLHAQKGSAQNPEQIISRLLEDVRATLSQRWQGFTLIPFGSLTEGIDTKSSDLDIDLRLRNLNYTLSSSVFEETKQLLQQQPTLYTDVTIVRRTNYVRCSFKHILTQRKVDLVFHLPTYSDEAVQTSRLLKYFFNLDERNNSLVRFLVYLFNTHGVASDNRQKIVNYIVYMLLIFYLQQKNIVPTVYELQKNSQGILVSNWEANFNELPYSTMNDESLYQLLGGFFKYYSEFNFEEYIVSPYTGLPIPRSAFMDGYNLPQEHFLDNYFNRTIQLTIRNNLKCSYLCIQGVFIHDSNEGALVTHENLIKFKKFVKSVSRLFQDLPSDSLLRALLVVDEHKETVSNHNKSTADGMKEENCIEVSDA